MDVFDVHGAAVDAATVASFRDQMDRWRTVSCGGADFSTERQALLELLPSVPWLCELKIVDAHLPFSSVASLCKLLVSTSTLFLLDLTGSSICSKGMLSLCRALRRNSSVIYLSISPPIEPTIRDAVWGYLQNVMQRNIHNHKCKRQTLHDLAKGTLDLDLRAVHKQRHCLPPPTQLTHA